MKFFVDFRGLGFATPNYATDSKQVLELYSSFSRQYLVKVVVQLKLAMINKPNIDIIINI